MFQIAIDGPAGSGKSTIAKIIAHHLNFLYVSTGKYYRAYAYVIKKNNFSLEKFLTLIENYHIHIDQNKVLINGEDVSDEIMTESIGQLASEIATNEIIRKFAINLQKQVAKNFNIVMDGRDIGTVVLPNAQLKIFLIANSLVRAKRRVKELNLSDNDLERIKKEIEERDLRDETRLINPLVKAKDAIVIDTSDLSIEKVVEKILYFYKQRI